MPPKKRGIKRTNNANGPNLKKPRRLPGFDSNDYIGEEGEDSSTPVDDDPDCSPPETCIPGQSEDALADDLNDQEPPCLPLNCQPCPHWEREIVKFNSDGKWDPKIKEKGHTGRPDLKGNYSEEGSKKKGSGCRDGPEGFVALGEPCNAYRCYLDPCVPPGTVYCTLKHGRQMNDKNKPNCPPKFPIKPIRYEVCPPDCSRKGQQDDCRPPDPQDCQSSVELEIHLNGQDPCGSNQRTRSGNQASSWKQQQQDTQCLQVRNNQLGAAIDPTTNPFSQPAPPWRRIEDRLPPEWIMELPSCQNQPKIKSKSRKKR